MFVSSAFAAAFPDALGVIIHKVEIGFTIFGCGTMAFIHERSLMLVQELVEIHVAFLQVALARQWRRGCAR